MATRLSRPSKRNATDRCGHCGAGLLHELVTFEATTPEARWKLCAGCVGHVVEQLTRRRTTMPRALLDDLWGLPPRRGRVNMPFGKFKGLALEDLPEDYRYWFAGLDDLRGRCDPRWPINVIAANNTSIGRWFATARIPRSRSPSSGAGIRSLAKKTHPDAGGSHDAFLRVGAVGDWLRATLRSGP